MKNSVALETDAEVTKLETEFRHIEEVLSSNLQSQVRALFSYNLAMNHSLCRVNHVDINSP